MAEEQNTPAAEAALPVDEAGGITLADLHEMQAAHRADIAALRDEIAKARQPVPQATQNAPSAEDALAARMAEIEQFPFYCPGCGALYKWQRECIGIDGAHPHAPIEVVSTDELKSGDPTQHTAAPVTTT